MKNIYLKVCSTLFILILFISCGDSKQNISAENKEIENKQYSLVYSDVMDFTRGIESSYEISGIFANDKSPRITIDGLPDGATYENNKLTWTPSCDLSPENGKFIRGYMVQRLRINFESSLTESLVQKPAIMIIHKSGTKSTCDN